MPTEANYVEAQYFVDRAAEGVRRGGDATRLDFVAAVGLGYAVLALMDEVIELRKQLAGSDS
jgi:hypothetical protein